MSPGFDVAAESAAAVVHESDVKDQARKRVVLISRETLVSLPVQKISNGSEVFREKSGGLPFRDFLPGLNSGGVSVADSPSSGLALVRREAKAFPGADRPDPGGSDFNLCCYRFSRFAFSLREESGGYPV